ncbi:DUF58 domain-containing protein [Erythrobacter sp. THAF29]|uniref:DUF58 domain-containing protein n=1 Tax=Erythrobacter sp. THAF29 TaxID=2587851 RepID=UPI0012679601|nr:DUF58 domain-containing protein [Erythrobacter sp. THAF29]QFT78911.1 hypothetical protein FIU90_15290 [Erythrobacter sp. THAF29]
MSRFRLNIPLVPTERAAWLIAIFAPVALVIAAIAPRLWVAAPAAAIVLVALIVLDGLLAGSCRDWMVQVPSDTEVGQATPIEVFARFSRSMAMRPEAAIEFDARLGQEGRGTLFLVRNPETGTFSGKFDVHPERRGTASVSHAWLRWTGPLGLGARQVTRPLEEEVRIWPDLSPVRSQELQTFLRDSQTGLIARRIRGEGTQFESLSEYEAGMDRRRIDWKASARHNHLYARENESERNNQIVFAFDCGQSMCEPVDGMPRIDRAVSAALTCAYVALKSGDRVSLFGFAQRPQVMTPFIADSRAFHRLQSAAAGLDYEATEPNFTLALATLTSKLKRRSLIILFSDFTDPTAAELMVESIGRLVEKHLVLFVTIADSELENFISEEPGDIATLARSVTADSLATQRSVVLQRLRRMGVDVIEAPWEQIGYRLIDRYFVIKNSEAIG